MTYKDPLKLRKWFSQQVRFPQKGESVAITHKKDKTAALCYDRICGTVSLEPDAEESIPESIRCFANTDDQWQISVFEEYGEAVIDWFKCYCTKRLTTRELIKEVPRPIAIQCLKLLQDFFNQVRNLGDEEDVATKFILRRIARSFSKKWSVPVVTIYESERHRAREYNAGDAQVIIASLSDLSIVDENRLTWEQVLQFRADRDARQKYRRLVHWLDKDMIGKSQAFIEDEIAERLQNYEQALAKHGIKTVVGTIQEALDGKFLAGASAVTGSVTLAGHPPLGILIGAGLILGKVVVKIGQSFLEVDDIERGPNSEISWGYEVKKLHNKSKADA